MKLKDLIRDLPKIDVNGPMEAEVKSIACDSRKCEPLSVFVAIRGTNTDGHDYIDYAIDKGSKIIICESIPDEYIISDNLTFIRVRNSRKALAHISHKFYNNPSELMKVIGITGTNGKTTTTYLLKSILEGAGEKVGLIGTTGIMIGDEFIEATHTTPESLELAQLLRRMADEKCSYVVMEVSSHALHQHRTENINFYAGLFTNLTPDHLDYHQDMQEYASAKKMLFDGLNESSFAVLFDNSDYTEYIRSDCRAKCYLLGRSFGDDFIINNEQLGLGSSSYEINSKSGDSRDSLSIRTILSGKFNIDNSALAAVTAGLLGINHDIIIKSLSHAAGAPGRMQTVKLKSGALAIVDYAHTPDALEKALIACREVLHEGKSGNLLCVFGCGGDRDKTKRPVMGSISASIADLSIITSDNPRTEEPDKIIEEIYAGIGLEERLKVELIPDRKEAIQYAINNSVENDILLVAGKGHENYQVIGLTKYPFSDFDVLKEFQ